MDKRYSKGADDDVLSLPDLTLPKKQSVNQDGNGFYEEGKATVVENSTLEDIDSIVDVLPLTMNAEPLVLTIDNAICSLDLSNTTKKYIGVHFSNYSFSSDIECKRRNQFIDKLLREREESVKQTEEYRDMVNSTLSDQTAVFANDHISIQHTRLIFKELRQKEKNITQELERRMRNQTCFSSVIDKYTQMKKELETTRVGLWNEVKATLQKEKEEAVTSKRIAPRFVSQGEVYNAYRSYLTDKRVKQRSLFQDVKLFSDDSPYCDGCRIPTAVKNINVIMNYPQHVLIRKFVGDKEVKKIYSEDNRSLSL